METHLLQIHVSYHLNQCDSTFVLRCAVAIIQRRNTAVNVIPQYCYGIPKQHYGMMRLVATLRQRFGKRLRQLRVEKGFNQLYLAELSDTSEDFISLVERGINAPSFETIEALASALETDVTALFTFPGEEYERQRVRMVQGRVKKMAAETKQRRKRNLKKKVR